MLQVVVAADLRSKMSHSHHRSICSFDSKTIVTHLNPVQTVVLLYGTVEAFCEISGSQSHDQRVESVI